MWCGLHRLTAYLRLPRTNYCEIASGFYSSNDVDIDEYVGNPEKKEKGVNTCREFRFKPCPVRMNRTDGDGLVGTQGNGGADGKTPGTSACIQTCV